MANAVKKYNPNRSAEWNYGGRKWRLSRSKIEEFVKCARCFYLDNKLGTGKPRGPAFTLNIAVDALLKKEFDIHRAGKKAHPLMRAYGIDALPFGHDQLDVWRDNFRGIEFRHSETGLLVSGAVDDVWVNPQGELIVIDYKATSKNGSIETLEDSAWAESYARQMGVYQWLLQQNGYRVSKTGYFVYANGDADKAAFDGKLEFKLTLVPLVGDNAWIEPTLRQIKLCLDNDAVPPSGTDCEFCIYREAACKKLQALARLGTMTLPLTEDSVAV